MMVPSAAELNGELKSDVDRYAQAVNANSSARINLYRLAVDASTSGFSGRQQLYERYFAGDPVRAAAMVYNSYETGVHRDRIEGFLETTHKVTQNS